MIYTQVAKKFGRPAVFLLKLIFRSEAIDYSELYLNLSCRKLIIYDPLDDNIDNISSLKTGLARRVMSLIGEPELTNCRLLLIQSCRIQMRTQGSTSMQGLP